VFVISQPAAHVQMQVPCVDNMGENVRLAQDLDVMRMSVELDQKARNPLVVPEDVEKPSGSLIAQSASCSILYLMCFSLARTDPSSVILQS
jgi:hypothetical protein